MRMRKGGAARAGFARGDHRAGPDFIALGADPDRDSTGAEARLNRRQCPGPGAAAGHAPLSSVTRER